ncbi:MAG: pilus assembly PilX family protein [Pseudomonadota bacterium]
MQRSGVSQQRGMALVLSLIFLVIITVLSLSSMQGAITQDRMAANQRDYTVAFQAAEAALGSAESQLQNGIALTSGWRTHQLGIDELSRNPRYRVQLMTPLGSHTNNAGVELVEVLYRIEAQGFGIGADTNVALEALYVRQQQVEAP